MPASRQSFLIKTFKALRGLFVTLVSLIIIVPVALYIILSSDWAQDKIRDIGQSQLYDLLGTEVKIGDVNFSPFNRLDISDVTARDDNDSIALRIAHIDTRFEFWDLLFHQKIIIDYATISGLDLKLYRDSLSAPLNIAKIVERLKKPDEEKKETLFRLRLNDVTISDCALSYNVLDQPETPDRFNASHISLSGVSLAAFVPVISNDRYNVRLRTLALTEQSGFHINDLDVNVDLTPHMLDVSDFSIKLDNSLLKFADIKVPIDSVSDLVHVGETDSLNIRLLEGSHFYLPDAKAFVPILGNLDYNLNVDCDVKALRTAFNVSSFNISDPAGSLHFRAHGAVSDINNAELLRYSDVEFELTTDTTTINNVLKAANPRTPPTVRRLIDAFGCGVVKGYADGTLSSGIVDVDVNSKTAKAALNGTLSRRPGNKSFGFDGVVSVDSLMLGHLLANNKLNKVSGTVDIESTFGNGSVSGNIEANISHFDFNGYTYHDISATATMENTMLTADLNVNDPNLSTYITGYWERHEKEHVIDVYADFREVRLDTLHFSNSYPGFNLTGKAHVEGRGRSYDLCTGVLTIDDLSFKNAKGEGITLNSLYAQADNVNGPGRISVVCDYLNGSIDGHYTPSTLVPEVRDIVETILPALSAKKRGDTEVETKRILASNNFDFDFTFSNCENICEFFKLPVVLIDKAKLYGTLNGVDRLLTLNLNMPWIGNGNNIIEGTSLAVKLNNDNGKIFLTSMMPTKKGDMDISANINARDGRIDSKIDWTIRRAIPINGVIDFTTILNRDADDNLITQVNFNPGKINFGDDIWSIGQSMLTYCNNRLLVNDFELNTPTQNITVNGIAGPEPYDQMKIQLNNIQLIDIFETLEIDNALICGYATGTIEASALLGRNPVIECECLKVKSIGYNYCILGDADVKLSVDDGGKLFNFYADVYQPMGYQSSISGYIEPATEGLLINIDADHVKVGFMKPFMQAFTSEVDGFASGTAKLYGTFKDIDMVGDIYVDDLKIKIDFTNTYYHASDSIHIRPGKIELHDITIRDDNGNSALLNGWVGHEYFHNATFDFSVTNAHNFLSYDVTEKLSPLWYGRIFGNGSATVKGGPGVVDIGVNMSTAENSTFTFVLSDAEEAGEYSFITFRDATVRPEVDSLKKLNQIPDRVKLAKQRGGNDSEEKPTAYNMDINVDVSPQALVTIVMDPVGGDRIRANGSGHMRMTYGSIDNDLRLYGTYTLDKGSYNFTLQDIIIKDFTIKEGSSITFLGDPYNAQLDINAYYQVNANLSDLDDSFLEDKELNRTNVQVRAILIVKGDMLQPDISFDLEFPTLTQDIYRKVRSIVSTEDMMNRQIIYLLALNRFYTPEYMASTTKGNELFSVASSTISSQLSSMLGKLSDNWSIAPNLRSDRGDFSDIEVDLTLSSSLLNNRLLFNGNFGYRDKSLNTNQFIGDFDIEYLLDRSGEWRLKAYNRYNDQNYYLRTAQTTQGVGIVYRRDFDKTFRFLKHLKKDDEASDTISMPTDTIIETLEIKDIQPESPKTSK